MSNNKLAAVAACIVALPTVIPDALSLGSEYPVATMIVGSIIVLIGFFGLRFLPEELSASRLLIRLTGASLTVISFFMWQFQSSATSGDTITKKLISDISSTLSRVEDNSKLAADNAQAAHNTSKEHLERFTSTLERDRLKEEEEARKKSRNGSCIS